MIERDGVAVGDGWLQDMNLPRITPRSQGYTPHASISIWRMTCGARVSDLERSGS